MKPHVFFCLFILIFTVLSCDLSEETVPQEESFIAIYDKSDYATGFEPLNVTQTLDSGYLVYGIADVQRPYLMKVDARGNFAWEEILGEPYIHPLPGILTANGNYFFFCMDELNLGTYLLQVDENTGEVEVVNTFLDVIYPLAVSLTSDNHFLLLSYNRDNNTSQLTKIAVAGNRVWEETYEVQEDVEPQVVAHIFRTGTRRPFITGGTGNTYYFNGYTNFSFSLQFVNGSNGEPLGVINGVGDAAVINAILPQGSNAFSIAHYNDFGDNFILPQEPVDIGGIGISSDLEGIQLIELPFKSDVLIRNLLLDGTTLTVFGSTTQSGQTVLYSYDAPTGTLLGTLLLGQVHPYTLSDFEITQDGGLVIVGATAVNGRFSRIFINKLSAARTRQLINPI